MQVGLVELQGCSSPGGLGRGSLRSPAGEEDQKTGRIHRKEVREEQGRGFPRICRGGNTRRQQNNPKTSDMLCSCSKELLKPAYLKAEINSTLCSVLSSKPRSNLKNKMLASTILKTLGNRKSNSVHQLLSMMVHACQEAACWMELNLVIIGQLVEWI